VKILVPLKFTVDADVQVRPLPGGGGVDVAGAARAINPFDAIALEAALRLKEAGQAQEVMVISIGPAEVEKGLRTALAMGADRAVHVPADELPEPLAVAHVLEQVARAEKPDLILMGKQAIDDDCGCVPPMLAARLGWPQAMFVSALEAEEGKALKVACEMDFGLRWMRVPLPCVLGVDLRLNEPRFVSLGQMMKAKRKPIEVFEADMPAPRLRLLEVSAAGGARRQQMLAGVDELLQALRAEGVLGGEEG
jgi:electron transfer flavoprotein beta subunit